MVYATGSAREDRACGGISAAARGHSPARCVGKRGFNHLVAFQATSTQKMNGIQDGMKDDSIEHLRMMMLIRAFETALAKRRDHGFQLLSSGEEAVAVGLCSALGEKDQLLTGGRSIGPALARGVDPSRVMAELLGKATGTNHGKGGRGHLADPGSGFFGAHAV